MPLSLVEMLLSRDCKYNRFYTGFSLKENQGQTMKSLEAWKSSYLNVRGHREAG